MKLLIIFIKAYRLLLSPWVGMHCRFTPTCSQYAIGAIKTHGIIKGTYLAVRRLLRCHPFAQGGYDPVSESDNERVKMHVDKREQKHD